LAIGKWLIEVKMDLKKRIFTPQEYIQVGMAFFLIGIFTSMVADGRLIGAFIIHMIPDKSLLASIQGVLAGFSVPIFGASIFFNLRGLSMARTR
jgi:hypothetical protein